MAVQAKTTHTKLGNNKKTATPATTAFISSATKYTN